MFSMQTVPSPPGQVLYPDNNQSPTAPWLADWLIIWLSPTISEAELKLEAAELVKQACAWGILDILEWFKHNYVAVLRGKELAIDVTVIAIQNGQLAILDWFLQNMPHWYINASVIQPASHNFLPELAARYGQLDILKWVVNHSRFYSTAELSGYWIVYEAIKGGHFSSTAMLDLLDTLNQKNLLNLEGVARSEELVEGLSQEGGTSTGDDTSLYGEDKPEEKNYISRDGIAIVYEAIKYNQLAVLDWIKQEKPEYLKLLLTDTARVAIIVYAVEFSNIQALDWIKANMPELFDVVDERGDGIAHEVIWQANRQVDPILVLNWINDNMPDLLFSSNNFSDTESYYTGQFAGTFLLSLFSTNFEDMENEELPLDFYLKILEWTLVYARGFFEQEVIDFIETFAIHHDETLILKLLKNYGMVLSVEVEDGMRSGGYSFTNQSKKCSRWYLSNGYSLFASDESKNMEIWQHLKAIDAASGVNYFSS